MQEAEGKATRSSRDFGHVTTSLEAKDGGIDVDEEGEEGDGTLVAVKHGILDSLAAKEWAVKLATEAAVKTQD